MGNKEAHKNIVLCSDGTGNSDTEDRGTNVFKLYEAVDKHSSRSIPDFPQQIAFYDDGVGTENFALNRMIGAAFGFGFAANVRDLYNALAHVYNPGDKLFLFGFSRGAYTIRALSGLIQYCGVLDRSTVASEADMKARVRRCWEKFEAVAFPRFITRAADRHRRVAQPKVDPDALKRSEELGCFPIQTQIEFVGVWDTVGAVGMPIDEMRWLVNWICPRKFDELTPGEQVKRACHALAIDDERRTFHPELWNEQDAREGQIDQVWFSGVHSNVGGGYSKQGMSLVTLDWMMSEAEKSGLRFIQSVRDDVIARRDVHDKLYDSRSGFAVYYRWRPRDIGQICRNHGIEKPKIHASVFARVACRTDGYGPGNIPANLEIVNTGRTPGQSRPIQIDRIRDLVQAELQSLGISSLQDLPDVRFWTSLGRIGYYGFLALTAAVLYWGLRDSVPGIGDLALFDKVSVIVRWLWQQLTSFEALWQLAKSAASTWWIPAGLLVCYGLSLLVDERLEHRYSNFWHRIRSRFETELQ